MEFSLVLSVEPTAEPLNLTETKQHLRVTHTNDDAYITDLITSVRRWAEGFQGRAYLNQTWKLYLHEFPDRNFINLPRAPLSSVTSVKYTDSDGNINTMSSADYIVDTNAEPGRIVLGYNKDWPTATLQPVNGVEIIYVSGYGATASSVPRQIKNELMLRIASLYQNRMDVTDANLKKLGLLSDLWQDRLYRVAP